MLGKKMGGKEREGVPCSSLGTEHPHTKGLTIQVSVSVLELLEDVEPLRSRNNTAEILYQ